MVRAVVLFVVAIAGVSYLILETGQMTAFMEVGPFVFVFAGGILLALGVTDDHDKLSVQRLEAFRYGCTLFGVIGTLIGFIAILGNMDELKAIIGPAVAVALQSLLWAAVLNYFAKLAIISKSNGG